MLRGLFLLVALLVSAGEAEACMRLRHIYNKSRCTWHVYGDSLLGSISFYPATCGANAQTQAVALPMRAFDNIVSIPPGCTAEVEYWTGILQGGNGDLGFYSSVSPNNPIKVGWGAFDFDTRCAFIKPRGTTPNIAMNEPVYGDATIFTCGQRRGRSAR